jgi:hypothetical protein
MECIHFDNGICKLASSKAGMEIPTYKETCLACKSGKYVIDGLITIQKYKEGKIEGVATTGPGSELKKLISWLPVPGKKNCANCTRLVIRMNGWGPDKCEQKRPYILTKLKIAATRRKIPFSEALVSRLVTQAINNARKRQGA